MPSNTTIRHLGKNLRGETIQPGDTLREFEELDIVEWDPAMEPAEGDFRIGRGRPSRVVVDFSCIPVAGPGVWLSAGPWELFQCDGFGDEACREDFIEIGEAVRHDIRGCASGGDSVRLMAWACRE